LHGGLCMFHLSPVAFVILQLPRRGGYDLVDSVCITYDKVGICWICQILNILTCNEVDRCF